PSSPVNKRDLFAGRFEQIDKISEAINTRGRHAIMYGDRGVGKTSLANILKALFSDLVEGLRLVKVNCNPVDTFLSLWQRAFADIPVIWEGSVGDEQGIIRHEEYSLNQYFTSYTTIGPGEICKLLQRACSEDSELILVFDEFNRLADTERGLFAD